MESDYVTRLDEIAALRQQVKIAREALEDIANEGGDSARSGAVAEHALALMETNDGRAKQLSGGAQ